MSKTNRGKFKLTGKITMKNLIYDFSDPVNHKISFTDSKRRLEGKSFFSFGQSSKKEIIRDVQYNSSTGASLSGEFVWLTHPGFNFSVEPASSANELLSAKCKKIGPENFYSLDQIVLDDVLVNPDLTVTGKALVPFGTPAPGIFDLQWFDFEGTVVDNLITIFIGEPRWCWNFKKVI